MNRNKKIIVLLLISSFLVIMFNACSDKSDNIPTFADAPTVTSLVEEGWEEFRNKNFQTAVDKFVQANERDALNLETYLGLGWSYSMIKDFILAKANYAKAITFGSDNDQILAACYAGLSGVELAENNWADAVSNAEMALKYAPDFQLQQDNSINRDDIYLIKAQSYFEMDKFYMTAGLVEELSPGFLGNSNILEDSVHIAPTILTDTEMTGVAELNVPDVDSNPAQLVYVKSLTNLNISGANIKILDVGNGTSTIQFFSNPIPRATDTFVVEFYYALDYGQYIGELSQKLYELKELLK